MSHRLEQVRGRLQDLEAGALFISELSNIRWTCGFTGTNGLLIVGPASASFVTDGRYADQAQAEVSGAEIHVSEQGLLDCIQDHGLLERFNHVAFQADSVTVSRRETLDDQFESVEWKPVAQMFTRLVASKEDQEVERIRASLSITELVFEEIVGFIEAGRTEREVAAEIVYRHLKHGADSMAFDPIVASGPNAARPHARPTDRTLQVGDLVVLDMGCFREGYASDMTRTLAIGSPSSFAREGYNAVLRAQEAALSAARAGMTGQELDSVARELLEEEGFGGAFSHGLGHGLGLDVHEWPRVSRTGEEELPEGACVTIEPGVYLPEEGFGVRIEDVVVLRESGSENLTRADKQFVEL